MHFVNFHPLVLSALFAVVSVTSTDAFVATPPRSKTTASIGSFSIRNRLSKNSNGILKTIQSVVAEASPATTRLFMFENEEYDDRFNMDSTEYFEEWVTPEGEFMTSSITMAEADAMQESQTAPGEPQTTAPPQEGGLSPEPPSATTEAAGRTFLSTLTETTGLSAAASISTVAFGGLAAARGVLGQRQKKLDEEKRSLEEQQKRIETESAKLQADTSQNNLFLSTIGSVAVGTALTTGGFVEEFTESTVQSLEGMRGGVTLENGIKESIKGGGFKTTAGSIAERPALSQQELPYLESKIEQEATKQQAKRQTTNFLRNRRQKLSLKQYELEDMAAKREASIAAEEERLKAIAEEEERLRAEEEALRRQMLAEKNEAARLQKEAEEAEAARVKAAEEARMKQEAEEARIKKEAEEARIKKEAEEARIKKEAEEARIKKEAEEARIKKEAEEARIKKEAEEARIQKEKEEEAERLRILEEESAEKARQEAIAREERAIAILRQQEEELAQQQQQQQQRAASGSAIAVGANTLRDYASRFSNAFDPNQPSPAVDTEKLQLLLSQLGITPGIAGGIAAVLVLGGGVTAIKKLVDEVEEAERVEPRDGDSKSRNNEEDDLSSQVAILLEKKRKEASQQSPAVRKTLKIPVDDIKDESTAQNSQATKSTFSPSTGRLSNSQPPPPTKSGESTIQPKVTPPPAKSNGFDAQARLSSPSGSTKFGISPGPKSSGASSSNKSSNPFGDKNDLSSSGAPRTKPTYSEGSAKTNSLSSPADLPTFSTPTKFATSSKSTGPPNSFGSSPKTGGGPPGKKGYSPFGSSTKQASPGKQTASPFETSVPKAKSTTGFGFPPPKSEKFPSKEMNSPFEKASKQSTPNDQIISPFGASGKAPNFAGSPTTKEIPPFSASSKQAPFTKGKTPFGTATSKPGSSPSPKFEKFGGSPGKQVSSPFGNAPKQPFPKKQPATSFGTSPPERSANAFGSPAPKSTGSPNTFSSSPKKFVEPSGTKATSQFGMAPKQAFPGKQSASPFGSSSPFGSPSPTTSKEPGKKAGSPFATSQNVDAVSKETTSPFGNISSKASGSESLFGSFSKQEDTKKPFSPFSQQSVSQNKSKPSFSSSGPVYMPPTSKVNNAASLKNVYSSLDGKQKTKRGNGSQEKMIQGLGDYNNPTSSSPKKSFSPFGRTKIDSKSPLSDPQSTIVPPKSLDAPNIPTNTNDPNASVGIPPSSASLAEQGNNKSSLPYGKKQTVVKKSYSPYGRKPAQRSDNLPKVDPSSFSFGAPPSKSSSQQDPISPMSTSSFSFGPGEGSSRATNSFPTNDSVFRGATGNAAPVSSNSQSYGTASAPKPFAATGFPPKVDNVEHDQNNENSNVQ